MIVLMDLDGTLIDSAPDIAAAANAVMADEGLPPLPFATLKGFIGHGVAVLVRRCLDAQGVDDPVAEARMLAGFDARYETQTGLTVVYPGVPEALDALAAEGHRLGVVTNKPLAPARAVLAHLGLDRQLARVVGGDSLPQRKPDPAPLLHALAALGGGPACYVGDSEVDAEAATRAGLPLLLFTEGYRKAPAESLGAAATFDDWRRLPGLVAGLSSRG